MEGTAAGFPGAVAADSGSGLLLSFSRKQHCRPRDRQRPVSAIPAPTDDDRLQVPWNIPDESGSGKEKHRLSGGSTKAPLPWAGETRAEHSSFAQFLHNQTMGPAMLDVAGACAEEPPRPRRLDPWFRSVPCPSGALLRAGTGYIGASGRLHRAGPATHER